MLMETAIILALVVATYLSALSMALRSMSRLALQRRLEPVDRVVAGQWLVDHLDPVEMFTSLAKICFRVGIFVLVLVEFIGVGESAKLEPLPLFGSFALTVVDGCEDGGDRENMGGFHDDPSTCGVKCRLRRFAQTDRGPVRETRCALSPPHSTPWTNGRNGR